MNVSSQFEYISVDEHVKTDGRRGSKTIIRRLQGNVNIKSTSVASFAFVVVCLYIIWRGGTFLRTVYVHDSGFILGSFYCEGQVNVKCPLVEVLNPKRVSISSVRDI